MPRLQAGKTEIVHVSQEIFFANLKMTALGTSSMLHAWNPQLEKFVQARISPGLKGAIYVDGKDDLVSERCEAFLFP